VQALLAECDALKEKVEALEAMRKDEPNTVVLQAVLDAIKGTLDPHTQIADHPNVKFAQMERWKLEVERDALKTALALLHDDVADYARLNHLGGFQNHAMVAARQALGRHE
jgi:hypothetical protein